jgi:hypothetical protein
VTPLFRRYLATHDGNVLQDNVEFPSSLQKVLPDPSRDDLSLSNQLGRIELRYSGLEDFVSDGWQNTLIVAKEATETDEYRSEDKGKDGLAHSRPKFW